ncbi:hypothetical protein VNO78_11359 [Psophocarpus tetragonolobus]|uniref:Uncharacterized protein n=1 Tax=Psophocarpus tetragonolobus TaxID=3891 RepID=A0AAN9STI7_PSOTE
MDRTDRLNQESDQYVAESTLPTSRPEANFKLPLDISASFFPVLLHSPSSASSNALPLHSTNLAIASSSSLSDYTSEPPSHLDKIEFA